MSRKAGIVGAGIVGSLMAWRLQKAGWSVTLFDKAPTSGHNCSWAAAGLLDSVGALEDAEPVINDLAEASMEMWPSILQTLAEPVHFQRRGTIALVHPRDCEQQDQWVQRIRRLNPKASMEPLHREGLRQLEPEIDSRFEHGLYFPDEGHIDNRALLPALHRYLIEQGATLHFHTLVKSTSATHIETEDQSHTFSQVVDCRGLQANVQGLRGVRGELLILHAPDVTLSRPVRLLHPKQSIYVVPRPAQRFVVGATQIECEDYRNVSVRSALELLSAAFVVQSGFGEAEIVETVAHCRPAFADNKPRILQRNGVLHVNGTFRHGYLISPRLTELACEFLETGHLSTPYAGLLDEALLCA